MRNSASQRARARCLLRAELHASKPRNVDVLAKRGDGGLEHVLHGLARVLNVGLIEKALGLHDLVDATLHHLLLDLLGLAIEILRAHLDLALSLLDIIRDVCLRHKLYGGGRGELHGHHLGQIAELGALCHEVSLAVHLHHHAEPAASVNVGLNDALLSRLISALSRGGEALLAKELRRSLHVTVSVHERSFAVHHPRARLLAEGLDILRRNRHVHARHRHRRPAAHGRRGSERERGNENVCEEHRGCQSGA
mmetsp:Transcript_10387/g.24944  ORF Transcript_10387/g.24944 Transcript_10387/m.24944 type:complete len:252 (+) Transcript_10387:240-995(+)